MYTNGPRLLSSGRPTILLVSTPELDPSFPVPEIDTAAAVTPKITTAPLNDASRQEFSFLTGVAHVAMDGIGTHMSFQVFFELLGGVSLRTGISRTDEELMRILEDEWTLRYGPSAQRISVLPPSVEERAPSYDTVAARADFVADQARYIVSSPKSLDRPVPRDRLLIADPRVFAI